MTRIKAGPRHLAHTETAMTIHPPTSSAAAPAATHRGGGGLRILLNEHAALASMLHSLVLMVERGPKDEPERFFDVMRAMLFYIDEFPEKRHHPKETDLLFPRVARLAPHLFATIEKLELDHVRGEALIHALQHKLLAWEILGESRRAAFDEAAREYAGFYLAHMRLEESVVLPAASALFTAEDWKDIDAAFDANRDPFSGNGRHDTTYDRLFTRIVTHAPAPIGVGAAGRDAPAERG